MRAGILLLTAAAFFGLPDSSRAQTRLEQIFANMHGAPSPKAPKPREQKRTTDSNDTNWNDNFGAGAGEAVVYLGIAAVVVATTPFWLPAALFDNGGMTFSKYPYAIGGDGMVPFGNCDPLAVLDGYWDAQTITKGWSVRASIDAGDNTDDLARVSGQLFIDSNFSRLGLLANVTYYRERTAGDDPDAIMSDVNLTYRLTQCEWLQMHVGLGGRTWSSLGDFSGGVNAFYRGDVFPVKPVNLSTIFDIGNLDQSLFMHARAQIGVNWRHGELFLGYDWTQLAGVNLHGPAVGLRLWF